MVESRLPKPLVAGSIPVSRSSLRPLRKLSKYLALEQFRRREGVGGLDTAQRLCWAFQPFVRLVGAGDSGKAGQSDFFLPVGGPGFTCRSYLWADVAQEVERVLGKDEVTGSSPVIGSNGGPARGMSC